MVNIAKRPHRITFEPSPTIQQARSNPIQTKTKMPTATTVPAAGGLMHVEFYNVGPLTSVWTAPAACSTVPVAPSGLSFPFNPLVPGLQVDNCDEYEFHPECQPGGEKVEELIEEHGAPGRMIYEYHSPGLQCPDAWETVGVFAMNNGTPSASGLFSPTIFTYQPEETVTFPPGDFIANMFTSVLAPTETAVACCPSGFSADPYAGCYSNFPVTELAGETACTRSYTGTLSATASDDNDFFQQTEYTFTFYGATGTGRGINATAISLANPIDTDPANYVTFTATFDASGTPTGDDFGEDGYYESQTNRTGLAQRMPIFMVHSGEGADAEPSDGGDQPAAAGRNVMLGSSWTAVGAVLTAWGVGMAAGVGLLAAW